MTVYDCDNLCLDLFYDGKGDLLCNTVSIDTETGLVVRYKTDMSGELMVSCLGDGVMKETLYVTLPVTQVPVRYLKCYSPKRIPQEWVDKLTRCQGTTDVQ